MVKEIKYGGYTATPSDYECPDGELAAAINLVPEENGMLKTIGSPKVSFTLPSGNNTEYGYQYRYAILFIHKAESYTHYIFGEERIYKGPRKRYYTILHWIDKEEFDSITDEQEIISVLRNSAHIIQHDFKHEENDKISVSAIGNTLLVKGGTDALMHYTIWRDGSYKYLGDHLPELYLSFGLRGKGNRTTKYLEEGVLSDSMEIGLYTTGVNRCVYYGENNVAIGSNDNWNLITTNVLGVVNALVQEASDNGHFTQPFFVRYALRLYDGTLAMHSAPILMNPCTTDNPIVFIKSFDIDDNNTITKLKCGFFSIEAALDCKYIPGISDDDLLNNWKDIITSVDVFITPQIYTYDQSGMVYGIKDVDAFESTFIGARVNNLAQKPEGYTSPGRFSRVNENEENTDNSPYCQYKYKHLCITEVRGLTNSMPNFVFELPQFTEEKRINNMKGERASSFYFLTSIKLEDLPREHRKEIVLDKAYLSALTSREKMTDDYQTHDHIIPNRIFDYNNRLNVSGITRKLYNGYPLCSMLAYCNSKYNFTYTTTTGGSRPNGRTVTRADYEYIGHNAKYKVIVYLNKDGRECRVVSDLSSVTAAPLLQNILSDNDSNGNTVGESWGCYFYYPDKDAYKMEIIHYNNGNNAEMYHDDGDTYEVFLKQHDFLNGAFAFVDYNTIKIKSKTYQNDLPAAVNNIISLLNKMYTTEADNPFVFSTTNINTIGTGEILGISTAAKALSQGQFGQFPLYAFTTEGVWALEVAEDGTFKVKQPITRDVCINSDSITQLDNAVLFCTDRGIMLLSGSNSICISDSLDAEALFNAADLPKLADVAGSITGTTSSAVSFKEFVKQAKMLYDYTHQRIIVYNANYAYAYVYSLKSKQWGMMESDITDGLNSYPECLAITKENGIVNISDEEERKENTENATSLLITRPLKLDEPDVLKTISTVIQRGKFRKGHVQSILYGSRDLFSWVPVWSSKDHVMTRFRGTPYKYFRIALLCNLEQDESIFGCTIEYERRFVNKLR